MASLSFLSLSLFLLVLHQSSQTLSRPGSFSEEYYSRRQNVCQFDGLHALEPDTRIKAEAGVIESWNPNHDPFQCAGVAVVGRTIEANGLHLPSYTNTPQLTYIVRGRGILGTVFSGCAETFEEPQRGQGRSSRPEDRHQKIRHFREGDIVAIPAGVAYWTYNNGDRQLVSVTFLDTSNVENQLDQNLRTFCSMRLKENIGDPSCVDIFTPQAGRISTVNSFKLPILRHFRLGAERGVLYNNGINTPHWNLNAHGIIYVLRGHATIQVVDHFGQTFFDGEVRKGQILTVPQHHTVVEQARSEGFEWVSFKTNDNAWVSPLAVRTSVIRSLPEAVVMNAFRISRDQAQRLKYNREETFLLSSSRSSERRAIA